MRPIDSLLGIAEIVVEEDRSSPMFEPRTYTMRLLYVLERDIAFLEGFLSQRRRTIPVSGSYVRTWRRDEEY
jgi:hypothetical protein